MTDTPEHFAIELDRKSGNAMYLQLADELKYRIATGTIALNTKLPPVAAGAKLWGVNLHTVRQAYQQLAQDGVAVLRQGKGTFVTAVPTGASAALNPGANAGVASFIDWVSSHAKNNFGLDRETLAELLVVRSVPANAKGRICFVECSASQSNHHAAEIQKIWDAKTVGWSLEREDEPPPGPFISTYFHYNDIRQRWPHRMADASFVAIHPARRLKAEILHCLASLELSHICLLEVSETMARSVAADLDAVLQNRDLVVQPRVLAGDARDFEIGTDTLHLFTPRIWSRLSAAQQAHPGALEVEYEIAAPDMARLAHHFGWQVNS